jgi:hypothetical protein
MKNSLGVLVVHLQEERRASMNCLGGSFEDGLSSVLKVLRTAKQNNSPIYLSKLDLIGNRNIFPEVLESAGSNAQILDAPTYDPYFQTLLEEPQVSLENQIKKDGVKRLILTGFHHSLCVYLAFIESLKRGLSVSTSRDILFGDKLGDYLLFESGQIQRAIVTYGVNGTFYRDHKTLIEEEFKKSS